MKNNLKSIKFDPYFVNMLFFTIFNKLINDQDYLILNLNQITRTTFLDFFDGVPQFIQNLEGYRPSKPQIRFQRVEIHVIWSEVRTTFYLCAGVIKNSFNLSTIVLLIIP